MIMSLVRQRLKYYIGHGALSQFLATIQRELGDIAIVYWDEISESVFNHMGRWPDAVFYIYLHIIHTEKLAFDTQTTFRIYEINFSPTVHGVPVIELPMAVWSPYKNKWIVSNTR